MRWFSQCRNRSLAGLIFTLFLGGGLARSQVISQSALQQIQELSAEKEARTPTQRKLDSQLHYAEMAARGRSVTANVRSLPQALNAIQLEASGNVLLDIKANVTTRVLAAIAGYGGSVISALPQYRSIRASLPLLRVEALAAMSEIDFIRPADRGTHGSMPGRINPHERRAIRSSLARKLRASFFLRPVSQGDVAHGANLVRSHYGFDGTGVKVGVLSDGVNALASLQASGDLPSVVNIISGQAGNGDEGSAMLEIVYDLAPGAELYFATAASGPTQMAANILALQQAGCSIILDDWTYFAEGLFQDGDIADAVNAVSSNGVLYFSDAQNSGNLDSGRSGTWEGDFADSGTLLPGLPTGFAIHSFGNVNHDLITGTSSERLLYLKWSDPLGASFNDYDFYLLDNNLRTVLGASTNVQNGSQDPVEVLGCSACFNDQLVIVKHPGALSRALHVDTERGRLLISTDGATFGHNAAASAVTVAAVNVGTASGGLFTGGPANHVETYSSDGPRRIFYRPDGAPITPNNFMFATGGGTLLQKDDIAAADCASGHAPGFSIFCGTSAATPHAGAIAALIKSGFPQLTSQQILDSMKGTALDIMTPGVDRDSGSGIVMANLAVDALATDPALQASVASTSSPGPGQLSVVLRVTNASSGMALGVSLNRLSFRTLSGDGTVTSSSVLPIAVGSIAPGRSTSVSVTLSLDPSVSRFSIASSLTSQNGAGAILSSSASNAIVVR